MAMNDWNGIKVRESVVKSGAPAWYLWCYDNVPGGKYRFTYSVSGHCFKEGMRLDDMDIMKKNMIRLNATPQVNIIERDMYRLQNKPYLLAGVSKSLSTEWYAAYSVVSGKVARYVFMKDPVKWFKFSKNVHNNFFAKQEYDQISGNWFRGKNYDFGKNQELVKWIAEISKIVRFSTYKTVAYLWLILILIVATQFIKWENQFKKQPFDMSRIVSFTFIILFSVGTFIVTKFYFDWFFNGIERKYYLNPAKVIIALFALNMLFTQFQFGVKSRKSIKIILDLFKLREGLVIFILIFQLSTLGILYSSISGTENNRFFLQLTPYLFVLSAVLISITLRIFIHASLSIGNTIRSKRDMPI